MNGTKPPMTAMKITTKSFRGTHPIPERFTADGENINPDLGIRGVPAGTRSLALIMDDPDAPMGAWNHWIVWNIRPDTAAIEEDSVPRGAVVGRNDAGTAGYVGPSPPERHPSLLFPPVRAGHRTRSARRLAPRGTGRRHARTHHLPR